MSGRAPDLSPLFSRLRNGDNEALGEIVGTLYTEIHAVAVRRMQQERVGHTLQPTALVNEVYLRLMNGPDAIHSRHHFFALAAQAMRRVLVDHARHKQTNKRGGAMNRVTLQLVPGRPTIDVNVLALDEALTTLSQLDPRAARVVELRFFGGYTDKEVCEIVGAKLPTVRRDWTFARSWLKTHLQPVAHT
jgi:RNA polymerase sigma factor (TIGR02999 family)